MNKNKSFSRQSPLYRRSKLFMQKNKLLAGTLSQYSRLFFAVFALFCLSTVVAAAPTINANYKILTGTTPFDSNDAPGNDSSNSNQVVRTNDAIVISYQIGVSNDDASNVVLEVVGGPGVDFDLPSFCLSSGVTPPSTISGNITSGKTITCNIGDRTSGSASIIAIPGRVMPTLMQGAAVSISSSSISADGVVTQSFPGTTLTVSARPKFDILKNTGAALKGSALGPNGEKGLVQIYPIAVKTINQGFGAENATANIVLADDLSGISPNALLFQGWAGALPTACFSNGAQTTYQINSHPFGYTQTADGGPGGPGGPGAGSAAQSVFNSGSFTCPSVAAGGTATITIAGAALNGMHYPTHAANGNPLNANERYLVSGVLAVWFPLQDIIDNGNELTISNEYTTQNFTSISGQTNTDPNTSNNKKSYVLREENPGNGRYFFLGKNNGGAKIEGQTANRSGDGSLVVGQAFNTAQRQSNGQAYSETDYNNLNLCTSFDNSKQIIRKRGGRYADVTFSGTPRIAQADFTVEYGTGSFGPNASCDNADSPDGWVTNPATLPGGIASVTKVRGVGNLIAPSDALDPTRAQLRVYYTALSNPTGTIVPQWGTYRADTIDSGNWKLSSYDEHTALGEWGDRATITNVVVRIEKDTVPANQNSIAAGNTLSFELDWSATLFGTPPSPTTQVTITDILPKEYAYLTDSASISPTSVTNNANGTTTIVWLLPAAVINAIQTAITYDVMVKNTTPNGTGVANTVVIASPDDPTPETARTDTYSMNILNTAILSLFKQSIPATISQNAAFAYELSYANTGSGSLTNLVLIDVLPDNAWPRSPQTHFAGTADFIAVSGTNAETFEYTKTPVTSLNQNPAAASNQAGGSTVWCSALTGGTCPATAAEVTALRATVSNVLMPADGVKTIQVSLQSNNNVPTDNYSNNFTASANELSIPITSTTANTTAEVVYDYSDAPISYGAAQHILSALTLGSTIDSENAALFSADASGDGDDEDGVTLPALILGSSATITVNVNQTTGNEGYLQGWIDWNGDGDFADTVNGISEQIAIDLQFPSGLSGSIDIPVTVPGAATTNQTFARLRWSSTPGLDTTTSASDGEVEDYALTLSQYTYATPPGSCTFDGKVWYNTVNQLRRYNLISQQDELITSLPEVHGDIAFATDGTLYATDFTVGSYQIFSLDTTNGATTTVLSGTESSSVNSLSADELGWLYFGSGDAVIATQNNVIYRFLPGQMSTPIPWLDLGDYGFGGGRPSGDYLFIDDTAYIAFSTTENGSGANVLLKVDNLTADHAVTASSTVTSLGTIGINIWGLAGNNNGDIFAVSGDGNKLSRIELSPFSVTQIATLQGAPYGATAYSEPVGIPCQEPADYSDAPTAGTSYGDASHTIVVGIQLGATVTTETAGYNDANASGDADDGVTLPTLTQGATATIPVAVSGTGGYLQGWIDFDGNGTFDTGEQIATDVQDGSTGDTDGAADGTITLSVPILAGATANQTFARFRWSTTVGLDSTTAASDGEVEDYAVTNNPAAIVLPPGPGLGASTCSVAPANNPWQDIGLRWEHNASGGTSPDALIERTDIIASATPVNPVGLNAQINQYDLNIDADQLPSTYNPNIYLEYAFTTASFTQNAELTGAGFTLFDKSQGWHNQATGNYKVAILVDDNADFSSPIVWFNELAFDGVDTSAASADTGISDTGHYLQTFAHFDPNGSSVSLQPNTNYKMRIFPYAPTEFGADNGQPFTNVVLWDDFMPKIVTCAEISYDFGDAPIFGTSPNGSSTNNYGEASHTIVAGLYLGTAEPDADSANQPTATADGDDTDGTNDDDGLTTLPALTESAAYTIQVTTAGSGTLTGWIDYNGNGTFDSDESITGNHGIASAGGVVEVPIHIPAGTQGKTFMRLRYSTDSAARNPSGAATDGEVEDYQITIGAKLANPSAPGTTIQPGSVCTVYHATGADQVVTAPATAKGLSIKLWGAGGGHELTGSGYSGAGGYTEARFDHSVITPGAQFTLVVGRGGSSSGRPEETTPASVYGFGAVSAHDQGGGLSGLFSGNTAVLETDQSRALAIAGGGAGYEHSGGSGNGVNGANGNSPTAGGQPIMRGSTDSSPGYNGISAAAHRSAGGGGYYGGGRLPADANYSPAFGNYQPDTAAASGGAGYIAATASAGRLLFSPDGTITAPNNTDADYITGMGSGSNSGATSAGGNGLAVLCWTVSDFSDSPQTGTAYATAEHTISTGLQLGPSITAEAAAYDRTDALGDAASDDGVRLKGTILQDQTLRNTSPVTLTVTTQGNGRLHGWIDWDRDGVFGNNANERIVSETTSASGNRSISVTPPAGLTAGTSYARFRYSSDGAAASPTGAASDGEVEDYRIQLLSSYSISGRVFNDINVNSSNYATEPGIADMVIVRYDTVNGSCVSTRTNAGGYYAFVDTAPGDYQIYAAAGETVPVPQHCNPANPTDPAGYLPSTQNSYPVFTLSTTNISALNFGYVRPPTFAPDNSQTILPNSTALHPHVFTALSDGSVSFSISHNAADPATLHWTSQILRDNNCNSQLDKGDTVVPASINMTSRQKICIVAKVLSASNATNGAIYTITVQSNFTFGNGSSIVTNDLQTQQDITRVIAKTITQPPSGPTTSPPNGAGKLTLVKSVWNTSRNIEGTVVLPGETLRYTLAYENVGNGALDALTINDSVPAFTQLVPTSMLCTDKPAELPLCTVHDTADGSLSWNWAVHDKLFPGSSGSVSYEVIVE